MKNRMVNVWQVSRHSVLIACDRHCGTITTFFLVTWRKCLSSRPGPADYPPTPATTSPRLGMVSEAPHAVEVL